MVTRTLQTLTFVALTIASLSFPLITKANTHPAFEGKENEFMKIKINTKEVDPTWKGATEPLPKKWITNFVEPKLKMEINDIRKEGFGSYKAEFLKHYALNSGESMKSPGNAFNKHYWKNFGVAKKFNVTFKLGEITELDNCSQNGVNYWELKVPLTYLYENNPKVESSEQTIYALLTTKKDSFHKQKEGEKNLRFQLWDPEPSNFCKNNRSVTVDTTFINKWLDEEIFDNFEIPDKPDTIQSIPKNKKRLFHEATFPTPKMHFYEEKYKAFKEIHGNKSMSSKIEGPITVEKTGKAVILEKCSKYAQDYWEIETPISYKYNEHDKNNVLNTKLRLSIYKMLEPGNTPYGIKIAAWNLNKDICTHFEELKKKKPDTSKQDKEIQTWVKNNLPNGFTFYRSGNVLYMPHDLLKGKSKNKFADGFIRANIISMLVKATRETDEDWNKSFMMMPKTAEGTATLANTPLETYNCSLQGKSKEGYPVKENKWEMKWPITFKIGEKNIEETYWIRIESTEINGKTMNISFLDISPRAARICSPESLNQTVKNRKNQTGFANFFKKLEDAQKKKKDAK